MNFIARTFFPRLPEIRRMEKKRNNLYVTCCISTHYYRKRNIEKFNKLTDELNEKLYWYQSKRKKIIKPVFLDAILEGDKDDS